MKKYKLRTWVKVALIIIVIVILGSIIKKSDDDFIKGCMEAGYSIQHCEAHK